MASDFLKSFPPGWPIISFGDVVTDSAFGPRFSGDLYSSEGNVATLRTTDIEDDGWISYDSMPLATIDVPKFKKHLLRKDDLVVTRSGTCGIFAIFRGFEKPVLPGAFLIRFRLDERADVRFFRYLFNSKCGRAHVLSVAAGAVQQNLNITNLKKLLVPLPPISEQRRIVDILAPYDELIENNLCRVNNLRRTRDLLLPRLLLGHPSMTFASSSGQPRTRQLAGNSER